MKHITWPNNQDYPADIDLCPEPERKDVDLKWSVWSMDKGYWDECSPGTWEWMEAWFNASADPGNPEQFDLLGVPREVRSAPRKEIRWATVSIYPGKAVVSMTADWDNGTKFFLKEEIEADTFDELMHQIDHCEVELIRANHDCKGGRCIECGYPYNSVNGRRFVAERYSVFKMRP